MRKSGVALVIEDEWIIRSSLADELRERGWAVLETDSGEEAMQMVANDGIDLAITDIELAGKINGWDVAERLREMHNSLPIIYVSGRPAVDNRRVNQSLFFDKPYDPNAVADACVGLLRAVLKAQSR